MRPFLIACAILALAACQQKSGQQPTASQGAPAAQVGPVKGVNRSYKGQAAPDVIFNDPDGREIKLAKFRGVPVLVNLWASWCAPCVKELPTLDKLAAAHRNDGRLAVIAVSQDSASQESVRAFLAKLKIKDLGAYQDSKMSLSASLGPDTVLPTSILFDANGREVWRFIGDLDWTSGQAAKLLGEAGAAPKKA